jgi:hypothetical protein
VVQPWVSPDDLGPSSSSPYAYEACQTSSYILWSLSGRKYQGLTTVTEIYEYPVEGTGRFVPMLSGGNVYNVPESTLRQRGDVIYGGCNCGSLGEHQHLRLRGFPIRAIKEVRLGIGGTGDPLPPEEYWLENRSVLAVRGCHSLECIQVTYVYGQAPPMAGRRAARYLADQLVKSWEGSEECELPETVTSVTRQGVQYQLLDQGTLIDDMRTGIYGVDLFLKATNPDNARRRAKVFSPDLPKGRRVFRHTPTQSQIGPYDLQLIPGQPYTWELNMHDVGGGILNTTTDYEPRAQISGWNGAVLYELDANHFVVDDVNPVILRCTLTAEDTRRLSTIGQGTWDLYAVLIEDAHTTVHLMSSNVWLTSHRAA